ncbi:MAG: adenylate cyclase, partial [Bacteroidaceae bacterium]|nr:adenylate cyclase [Bacteroidaceae bacterium]
MAHYETERKFLVVGDFKSQSYDATRIQQGYIASGNGRTVRVRIRADKGYLTIKGPSGLAGLTRYEFDTEIPLADARDLLEICEPGIIDKTRYLVKSPDGRHT